MQEGDYVDGVVSLWVGFAPSYEALEGYVEPDYASDAQPHVSPLATDFGTGWYDHDLLEISVGRPTKSLVALLRGCSYESIIVPKFVSQCGETLPEEMNSFVLLYDFRHNGSPGPGANPSGPVKLRYIGTIQVDMPWPD